MTLRSHSLLGNLSPFTLSAAFTLTGIATVLPGTMLPMLLQNLHLHDSQAGFLFFLLWTGASAGALVARGRPERALFLGAALLTVTCVSLPLITGSNTALALFALYGLALGICMTSISLIRSRRSAHPGQELNRLNLLWAMGACLCPVLLGRAILTLQMRAIFLPLAVAAFALSLWTARVEVPLAHLTQNAPTIQHSLIHKRSLPLLYALITALSTGIESTAGGWIATHMQRLFASAPAGTLAAFCFWFGLFSARGIVATGALARWHDRTLVRCGGAGALLALCFLATGTSRAVILASAFGVGFAIGPVYPLLLAIAVANFRGNLVFSLGGVGAAGLPWLTGFASSRTGSLRTALLVPCAAAFVLAIASWPATRIAVREPIDAPAPPTL